MLSKWIFVLDGDQPGQELRAFIEDKYKDFLGQCVFVVQYERAEAKVELEDLLPLDVLKQALPATVRDNAAALSHAETVLQSEEPIKGRLAQMAARDSEPDSFSARFKESLNAVLSERAKAISAAQQFRAQFPAYFEWASGVLGGLSKKEVREEGRADGEQRSKGGRSGS